MVYPSANSWLEVLIRLQTKWKWHLAFNLRGQTSSEVPHLCSPQQEVGRSPNLSQVGDAFHFVETWSTYFLYCEIDLENWHSKINFTIASCNQTFLNPCSFLAHFSSLTLSFVRFSVILTFSPLSLFLFLKTLPRTVYLQNLIIIGIGVLLSCFLFPNRLRPANILDRTFLSHIFI